MDSTPFERRGRPGRRFLERIVGEETSFPSIAATDFFSVEVITRMGLVRYFVLFVIDLKTRRVEIAGILRCPTSEWMQQIARNLTDCEERFSNECSDLIHDRDPLFTRAFREILNSSNVETVKLPARSPNLNA
jgi:putative transposase